jgi:hypothetical protein
MFLGGAIDHAILANSGREESPHGLHVGVSGNWGMAFLDLVIALIVYFKHQNLESTKQEFC